MVLRRLLVYKFLHLTNMTSRKKLRGFTLIELLVVVAIIGVLSSVVLASLNSARVKSRDARRISDFKQIQIAMELFYDQAGKYPQSGGHAQWSGHWEYFSTCLEAGTDCGFTVSNFISPISQVSQDPSRSVSDPFAAGTTYYPSSGYSCNTGQYRIAACLETNHAILQTDLDGKFFSATGCNDVGGFCGSLYTYCVGTQDYSDSYAGC